MEILTTKDVADELEITEMSVRRYCQQGRLGKKVGRQWIITRAELDEFKKIPREPGRPKKSE